MPIKPYSSSSKSFLLVSRSFRWFSRDSQERAIMCSNQNGRPQHQQNGNGASTASAAAAATTLGLGPEFRFPIPKAAVVNRMDPHCPEAHCCCGILPLRHAVLGIAIVELLLFGYQLIACFFELFPSIASSNEHLQPSSSIPSHLLLSFLSYLLALVAILLLALGVLTRSPHMLLPHLLMQFALLTATFLIAIHVAVWNLGGVHFPINAIFFEHPLNGEQALDRSLQRPPIVEANFTMPQMRVALAVLLLLVLLGLSIQICIFLVVLNTFRYLRRSLGSAKNTMPRGEFITGEAKKSATKSTNGNSASPPLPTSTIPPALIHSIETCSSPIPANTNTTSTTTNSSANPSPPLRIIGEKQGRTAHQNGGPPSILSVQPAVVQISAAVNAWNGSIPPPQQQPFPFSNPTSYQSPPIARPEVQV